MKAGLMILIFFMFITSCVNNSNKKDLLGKNNKIEDDEFTVCDQLETAMSHPKEVIYLCIINEQINILPDSIIKLKKLKSISFHKQSKLDFEDTFNKLSLLDSLTEVEILDMDKVILPNNIVKLRNLKKLSISCTQTCKLPDSLIKCVQLESLDISGPINLPNGFNKLNNLRIINLIDNGLIVFPKEILNLKKVEEINLTSNKLVSIPKDIIKLKNLKLLILTDNPIAKGELLYYMKYKKFDKLDFIQQYIPKCKIKIDNSPAYL
jgi:Leucine-rich repeat (LRR) protein